ncbi:MAG: hypothetical protein M3Q61_01330, partial [Chloroflexota bacterium]|nr:hypothetical protein [Chloroflexota bacterium]
MTASVYVAASSLELPRARRAMSEVEAAGFVVASDWVSVIESSGGVANPTDATRARRADWSQLAMTAIGRSRALWLLAPES